MRRPSGRLFCLGLAEEPARPRPLTEYARAADSLSVLNEIAARCRVTQQVAIPSVHGFAALPSRTIWYPDKREHAPNSYLT
jgi:hypothetical protein